MQKVTFKCESDGSAEHSNGCDTTWQPAPWRRDMFIQNVKGSDRKLPPPPAPRTLGRPPEASDGHTSKRTSPVQSGAAFWNEEEGAAKVTGCRKMALVFKNALLQ